jgi:hypothetical protein
MLEKRTQNVYKPDKPRRGINVGVGKKKVGMEEEFGHSSFKGWPEKNSSAIQHLEFGNSQAKQCTGRVLSRHFFKHCFKHQATSTIL